MSQHKVLAFKGVFEKLSARERQIVIEIINEKQVIEIADLLNLKSNTISTFKKNIYFKLRVYSEIGIVKLAIKEGVIKL